VYGWALIAYWNGEVPPVTADISILPFAKPHVSSVTKGLIALGPPILLMVALALAMQPLLSVTVTV
jgi:hypothetical protein